MNQAEFLEKQWEAYRQKCIELNIEIGTKEGFIARNTPKGFKPDDLLDKAPKPECLTIIPPLMKVEENITISRRVLRKMLEIAAQKGYELAINERSIDAAL